jgi:hypothetical protein
MEIVKKWWNLLYEHRSEAAWGLFWAVVFWIIADLTSVDSRLRDIIRRAKDKRAEISVSRLHKRIAA